MAQIKHVQSFTGGMNTVISPELMQPDQYVYMLNCDVTSTAEGNLGRVTNLRGNVSVDISLPEGENKTIGSIRNDESNKMYFAVWNSLGFHSWFEFDYISLTTKLVMQCIVDTGNVDIWQWEREVLIDGINIVDDNLLYWTMEGHPARKINIQKAIEKSFDGGYGNVILDEYTRAYKRAPAFAPTAEYFTNPDIKSNNVFRKLFQWTVRFIYDDNEYSTFSDISKVAVPAEENVTGTLGVPSENNGIHVKVPTGGMLVKKLEIAMRSTTDLKGVLSPWVSIGVFDKAVLGIPDNSEFTYDFYNNNTYTSLPQEVVRQQQSDLPDNPKVQEFTYNTLVYGNFFDGFPAVKVDLDFEVEYSDLFVPDGQANVLNNPFMTVNHIDHEYESGGFLSGGGWRKTEAELVIGPDVKSGNIFDLRFTNYGFTKQIKANLNDDAKSIASKFRTEIANLPAAKDKGAYVGSVTQDGSGYAKFRFKLWNNWNKDYIGFVTSVTPVNYSTLKDTGNSVPNEKLGSSYRYALRYENEDGKRSLAYGNSDVVSIETINELGSIKKVATNITINHKAPSWATRYSIVRTKNLSQEDYIQLLIQRVNVATTSNGEEYRDLIIGSLFTYQKVHPNSTLNYDFKKGDRVRLLKNYSGSSWSVPSDVIEYEVLAYYPEVSHTINSDITIDGTANVITDNPDNNNIGNNIIIDGNERTITGVSANGYVLDSNISVAGASTGSSKVFPSYQIVNRDGVLRIKMDPSYPIDVDPATGKFALVEVYTPAQNFTDETQENYYDTGYKFEIVESNGQFLHRGNSQDQTDTLPAIVRVEGFDNYVRNRDLITNNSETNPQSVITSIEDRSYSDFYQSDISSLGRPTRLDDSRGVVHFEDRLIWSNNFIEDTKINGLNMFLSTNRVDYNDKYGSIQKIIFYEGKLYVFKFLKTGWVPVLGNLIVDSEGNQLVGTSTRLLPDKMEYFLWEGGVGNNPESIVKIGNDIFGVSPNSQVIFTIGGAGVIPTSKIYGIDNHAREIINDASLAKAHMYGGLNRKKNQYLLMVEAYNKIAYQDKFSNSNTEIVPVPVVGEWQIVSNPSNGSLSFVNDTLIYSPASNFSGMDYFSYRSIGGITRNDAVNVLSADTIISWVPSGQYCVVSGTDRTGEVGYTLLSAYDNITQSYTGEQKPNSPGDPDYVAPVMNTDICPIGLEFTRIAILSADKGSQNIEVTVETAEPVNIQARSGQSYTGSLIDETGNVGTGTYTLDLPVGPGEYALFLTSPTLNYNGVTKLSVKNAYIKTAKFNDLKELTELVLDQSLIPQSHNLVFNSLDISQNTKLTKLHVKHHRLSSVSLTPNTLIQDLDLSNGINLTALGIGSWSAIRQLRIHDSAFTKAGYTTSFIDSIIASFNANTPSSSTGRVLQYGLSNLSGIKPSGSALANYNSLISKGVSVIGVPPTPSEVTVYVSNGHASDDPAKMIAWVNLSSPLSVDINVEVYLTYRDAGHIEGTGYAFINVPAGQFYAEAPTGFFAAPGQTVDGTVDVATATPNPAGGVNLILSY